MKSTNGTMYAVLILLMKPEFVNCSDDILNYAIYRNIRILKTEMQEYELKLNQVIKKYGWKTEDGYSINVADTEAYNAFKKEMTPITDLEIDVDVFQIEPGFILPECKGVTPAQYLLIEEVLTKKSKDK